MSYESLLGTKTVLEGDETECCQQYGHCTAEETTRKSQSDIDRILLYVTQHLNTCHSIIMADSTTKVILSLAQEHFLMLFCLLECKVSLRYYICIALPNMHLAQHWTSKTNTHIFGANS